MLGKTDPGNSMTLSSQTFTQFIDDQWDHSALPELVEYIRIPNKSPMFDSEWQSNGHMDTVVQQFEKWCLAQEIPGMQVEVVQLPDRTPLLYLEIPGETQDTVLLYGHLDKQPEMTGWREGFGPWIPVIENDRLYGRGGADDGYALFASLIALMALHQEGIPHARCVVLIEACEESGSPDLPYYIDALKDRIGKPGLVICLDSGCGNYEQLWCTTSLRGLVGGNLTVEILEEGVHSGDASGIVPDTFRILRELLANIDDSKTGWIAIPEFNADIPDVRLNQASHAAEVLGDQVYSRFPFVDDALPVVDDPRELILNRTWRPALSVTGADGLPSMKDAGNVLRASTSVKISLRLPPTTDPKQAAVKLKTMMEQEPPYGARVSFTPDWSAGGWHAPIMDNWLAEATNQSSLNHFGKEAVYMGEGGSIPFMGMLGEKFPEAQFLITGVLGPQANAHGPNEFLHIPYVKKLTCCVADVIAAHYQHQNQ